MIIQASMRTDIPAFYSAWFLNRLREGFVLVRNPYNPSMVTRYSLSPEVVDLIAFCTKNPAPKLNHLDALKPYGQYWFVTITPYGREIEPNVPDWRAVVEDFKRLSDAVGVDVMGWRYDPIFVSGTYSVERHLRDFEVMARSLAGYTRTCVISFVDLYQKVKRGFPEVREVTGEERILLGRWFAEIAAQYGMRVKACAEGRELAPYGVDCQGCMTVDTYEKALREKLNVPKKKPTRKECACLLGSDIGAYHTCGHQCRYCYANDKDEMVRRNLRRHDPNSPFLLGGPQPGDQIHVAKQESWLDLQLRF